MANVIDGSHAAGDASLYLTERRSYEVRLTSPHYSVIHTDTGALIARCDRPDTACAVADSREWADGQDAADEAGSADWSAGGGASPPLPAVQ
jgi:hypothetical protein